MESFEISLSPQQVDKLGTPPVDMAAFFDGLFEQGTANYRQLTLELQREFKQGGSPEVRSAAFDRVNYNTATNTGGFRIVLDISFTFGCEDSITEKKDQTSEWTFARFGAIIKFYSSPFAESRSTADEF